MNILITDITQLLTLKGPKAARISKNLSELSIVKNAALYIEDEKIKYAGKESDVIKRIPKNDKHINIKANGVVMPAFIDSHTHSVFARPRLLDFEMRANGKSYLDIKKAGGGINRSARDIKEASKKILAQNLKYFARKFVECGTTTVEVKSGYGLDLINEIKMLEVVKETAPVIPLDMIPTFLGAHSIPKKFSSSKEYLKYLKDKVLPAVAQKKLAKYVDIFVDDEHFGIDESVDYLEYAKKLGFIARVHCEQLAHSGGSYVASMVKAVSADHLDFADDNDIKRMVKSGVSAIFLPSSNYFMGVLKYPRARNFIENGANVVLATDFNPGTSPCWNMQFVLSVAVNYMKMSVEEAIVASTYNAACVLGVNNSVGMIIPNMQADLVVMDVKDYREIAYYFGDNLNKITIKKGRIVYDKGNTF
jgi:imidazolonepropionase